MSDNRESDNRDRIVAEFAKIPEVQMIIQGEGELGTTVFVLSTMPTYNSVVFDQLIGIQMSLMDEEIWDSFLFLPIELVDQPIGEVWFDRKVMP